MVAFKSKSKNNDNHNSNYHLLSILYKLATEKYTCIVLFNLQKSLVIHIIISIYS